uniref:AB hydrolase-1 domain-containing protein n=1 Tax=Zea mays TaxID=4577 RepID=A0A804N803_MAIZE
MADRQMDSGGGGKHFILLHGLAHGAWCWYKVVAQLRAAGHRATALDMAASGVHPARLHEVASFEDYSRPLLDAVAASPDSDRLVLVGHSLGGLSVALAMEWFPGKVAAAVFLAASMPRVGRHMGVTIEEDLELAKLLVRPGFQFMDDPTMKDETLLTDGNYGSVKRVFVVAKADRSSTEEMQRRMVELSPGADVEEVAGADHMAMLSKPTEVCEVLVRIAGRYD